VPNSAANGRGVDCDEVEPCRRHVDVSSSQRIQGDAMADVTRRKLADLRDI